MKEGLALQQLADVLPPPAPGWGWVWIIMTALLVLPVAALWWWMRIRRARYHNAPAREARRRLDQLRSAWQSQTVDDREAAYRLAALLRLGLGIAQLTAHHRPAAVTDSKAWERTLGELHALRYRHLAGPALSADCFRYAEAWLAAAQRTLS